MKRATIILTLLIMSSSATASQMIPPELRVPQLVRNARRSEKVIELWAVDYEKIRKSDKHLTKEKVFELLKSVDLTKLKLATHDQHATVIVMVEPQHIIFTFEARDSQVQRMSTSYFLIRIETEPVSREQRDEAPLSVLRKVLSLEDELAIAIAGAKERIQLDLAWVWPPDRTNEKRFSHFVKRNASRWELDLNISDILPGTVYEQTSFTEEGGSVSQYLILSEEQMTWWFDGRRDDFSEFKNPSVRRKKVSKLFLVVFDGKGGWVPIIEKKEMPLDYGLAIGIQMEDGSLRYW